ncbi:MAG: SpoIID/LytB domain-containing protein, partial [Muribaculaceae bacterium]|nr:SpoIID/LytB domain-containing protein [Muribaculaceae bacterium]
MTEPKVRIGIMSAPEITVDFIKPYIDGNGNALHGLHTFRYTPGTDLLIAPADDDSAEFELHNVTIGVGFHWERNEAQRFTGMLNIVSDNNMLTAINIVGAEEYLRSVISSEMSATSSEELLKAHAVISRSWLMSRIRETRHIADHTAYHDDGSDDNPDVVNRWYDSGSHTRFDVCADDHCQRYQGIA